MIKYLNELNFSLRREFVRLGANHRESTKLKKNQTFLLNEIQNLRSEFYTRNVLMEQKEYAISVHPYY